MTYSSKYFNIFQLHFKVKIWKRKCIKLFYGRYLHCLKIWECKFFSFKASKFPQQWWSWKIKPYEKSYIFKSRRVHPMTCNSMYFNLFQLYCVNQKLEKEMHQTCLLKRFKFLENFGIVKFFSLKASKFSQWQQSRKIKPHKKNPYLQKYKGTFFIFSTKQLWLLWFWLVLRWLIQLFLAWKSWK
jgi:hypothetical protein